LGIGAQSNLVVGSTGGNVAIGSATGSLILTSDLATTITSANEGISLTSELATSITAGTAINLSSAEATSITSTGNNVNITGNTGVTINSPDAITITSGTDLILQGQTIDITGITNISSINTNYISTGSLFVRNIVSSNITTAALSTTTISTATIFTNFINAPVNINVGKSIIPSGGTIDLGAQGFNYRELFVSSIRCVSSIITSTIRTDRLFPTFDSGVRTANLYANSASAQIGFGPALGSGGFYNIGAFRSTMTTHLLPSSDGAATANNIKVNGHLSTVSLGVSTINFKPYPFVSTLNNPVATASITTASAPILSRIQSNTLTFPRPGTYRIDQQYSVTKSAGGTNQHTHGSLVYASNGATVATVSNATNWSRMAMSAVPVLDKTGFSTLTSVSATILANSANLTRDVFYYDSGSGTYTVDFYLAPPTITYIPSPGINPDI
jgi:hypothetical protein